MNTYTYIKLERYKQIKSAFNGVLENYIYEKV